MAPSKPIFHLVLLAPRVKLVCNIVKLSLDVSGAEEPLLGKGDALIRDNFRFLERFQVAYTTASQVCQYFGNNATSPRPQSYRCRFDSRRVSTTTPCRTVTVHQMYFQTDNQVSLHALLELLKKMI